MLKLINLLNKSLPAVQNYEMPLIEVGQTVHFDEQVNAEKGIQNAPTKNTNNKDNITVQQNNEE